MSMDTSVSAVPAGSSASQTEQTQAPGVSGAGANAGSSDTLTGTTKIKDMAQLKKASPKLWNMYLQGIAMTIVNEMKSHQEKLKELMRKAEQEANGR